MKRGNKKRHKKKHVANEGNVMEAKSDNDQHVLPATDHQQVAAQQQQDSSHRHVLEHPTSDLLQTQAAQQFQPLQEQQQQQQQQLYLQMHPHFTSFQQQHIQQFQHQQHQHIGLMQPPQLLTVVNQPVFPHNFFFPPVYTATTAGMALNLSPELDQNLPHSLRTLHAYVNQSTTPTPYTRDAATTEQQHDELQIMWQQQRQSYQQEAYGTSHQPEYSHQSTEVDTAAARSSSATETLDHYQNVTPLVSTETHAAYQQFVEQEQDEWSKRQFQHIQLQHEGQGATNTQNQLQRYQHAQHYSQQGQVQAMFDQSRKESQFGNLSNIDKQQYTELSMLTTAPLPLTSNVQTSFPSDVNFARQKQDSAPESDKVLEHPDQDSSLLAKSDTELVLASQTQSPMSAVVPAPSFIECPADESNSQEFAFAKTPKRAEMRSPKRALTAYNVFFQEERERIIEKKLNFQELTQWISKKWREVDQETLTKCQEIADIDKERYKNEKAEYRRNEIELLQQFRAERRANLARKKDDLKPPPGSNDASTVNEKDNVESKKDEDI